MEKMRGMELRGKTRYYLSSLTDTERVRVDSRRKVDSVRRPSQVSVDSGHPIRGRGR